MIIIYFLIAVFVGIVTLITASMNGVAILCALAMAVSALYITVAVIILIDNWSLLIDLIPGKTTD